MRCKPFDLAVIVSIAIAKNEWARGFIVRVTHLDQEPGVWWLEKPIHHPDGRSRFTRIEDTCLKPIRDPGDDARDQTLDWLPIPTKEREHA